MNKELTEAVKLFVSQPLNNPLSRGQIMEIAQIALPILEQQERGEGEWIEWKGGECPVDASTVVEIKWRFGATNTDNADCYDWVISDKENKLGDIIAYRIIATNHNGEQ